MIKRFYKTVTYKELNNLYYFYLDDKPIKTPHHNVLQTESFGRAKAVITEWHNQQDTIILETMPITKYLYSVQDTIIKNYDFIIKQLLDYADNDCIFYFTEKTDIELYDNQQKYWLPIIHYFEKYYAVTLNYGHDLILKNQPNDFKKHIEDFLRNLSLEDLAGIYKIITLLGSVLLGIYAYKKTIPYDKALNYSRLEQDYNIKNWGLDHEAEIIRNNLTQDYTQTVLFLELG